MKRYAHTDYCGNRYTLTVADDGTVTMTNQCGTLCSASNVGYLTDGNGYMEQATLVRNAARRGLTELSRVTKLNWTETK